jgi:hypothetical protein
MAIDLSDTIPIRSTGVQQTHEWGAEHVGRGRRRSSSLADLRIGRVAVMKRQVRHMLRCRRCTPRVSACRLRRLRLLRILLRAECQVEQRDLSDQNGRH